MTKKILFALLLICSLYLHASAQKDSITISGIVTDFEGNAKDSAFLEIKGRNFGKESMYETYTNSDGRYSLKVKKGKYLALASMKLCEYPKSNSLLSPEDMRLEFWAWNVIAEEDMELNIHYHRLEIYGVTVFKIEGASPGYTIYCRPMSLSKYFSSPKSAIDYTDLCADPDLLDVKVTINEVPVKINMKQKVKEYISDGICNGYLLHVDAPKELSKKGYDIFRIEMTDLENGDKGEAVYFKEKNGYL
ncbi:hypothetical protein BZG01_08760 [Labilibaculum manganireducens]|uniref:Carboxypeptidase regulatory-like domain-containing protein n=1 Tax=Labilibaculum manganireducens TaxID=1940525 RepID=A0A2N3IA48_9BACT|nr:carboxypeptidase regulatory-like domain-containing protein [Labilibaculum manganireducens]PKQ67177.1 hypothetical protein BZG01_08760 [Labilibaculum manganireducens]